MVRVSTVTVNPAKGQGQGQSEAKGRPTVATGPGEVRVDLNERCFLFPGGKGVSHIIVGPAPMPDPDAAWLLDLDDDPAPTIEMRAVYAFNQSKADGTIDRFSLEDARALARAMIEGVYQARTQTVFLDGRTLGLVCNVNGFVLTGHDGAYDLFISGQLIITLANALLRVADFLTPVQAH